MSDPNDRPRFPGFPDGPTHFTPVPDRFFLDLLPLIDDMAQLQVLLFCFWALPQREGPYPYLLRADFTDHAPLMSALARIHPAVDPAHSLDAAIAGALACGAMLSASVQHGDDKQTLYFINTARARQAVEQINAGHFQAMPDKRVAILPPRPNVFRDYEQNVGPLTPMIADDLKSLLQDYPDGWLHDAIRLAVQHNKRSLRYIQAILKRWHQDGRQDGQAEDGKRYVSGEYADFIEH